MQSIFALVLIASAVPAAEASRRLVNEHPIQKIIGRLQGLIETSTEDLKRAELDFQTTVYNYKTEMKSLTKDIARDQSDKSEANTIIEKTTAELEALEKQHADLTREIASIDQQTQDVKDETRAKRDEYRAEKRKLEETHDALKDASQTLKENAPSFTQTKMVRKPNRQEVGAVSHTGGILEMVKDLTEDVEDEITETDNTYQQNVVLNARMALESMRGQMKAKNTALTMTRSRMQEAESEKTAAEGQFDSASSDLTDDTAAKATTEGEFRDDESTFKREKDSLEKSISSLGLAIEALEKATGVSFTAPEKREGPDAPSSFFQVAATPSDEPRKKALELLRAQAKITQSKALEHLVAKLASSQRGPFDQIINMIQKMVSHLAKEQQDEDSHKNWCDHELEKSNITREELSNKISNKDAEIKKLEAAIEVLSRAIENCNNKVAEHTEFIKEATDVRKTGKEENRVCIKDASDAQVAMEQAEAALQTFYQESSDETTAPVKQVMQQTMESFSRQEADCKANEVELQAKFEENKKASMIEIANQKKKAELKTDAQVKTTKQLQDAQVKFKTQNDLLSTAEQYFADLQPSCVNGDSTYEERKAARQDEITALEDAETLLKNYRK